MLNKTNAVQNKPADYAVGIALVAVLLVGYQAWRYFSLPPKLQASVEATKTLDAMFTALTARDSAKLATCMNRIESHFAAGKLGRKATAELRYCAELANQGSWDQAAKRLYWVVYEQT
ncbi:MAG: hypothetical protein KDA72_14105 [Planctomycetales bacterium]|nr:hypothetical protein [Planctomycetales bacterium]